MEQTLIYLVLIAGSIDSSRANPVINQWNARPNDFSVLYQWKEGSLPPPYHYEYRIELSSSWQGKVIMIPDYPSVAVPIWTEAFVAQSVALDKFYQLMIDEALLTNIWQAQSSLLVGGSSESMTVTANGTIITIPAFILPQQASAATNIFTALKALVPQVIWDKLHVLRKDYIDKSRQQLKTSNKR